MRWPHRPDDGGPRWQWRGSGRRVPSGRKWQGSQSSEGATELGFPGPAPGQMQGEAARRASEPSGDREEPPPEGFVGYLLLAQTDARRPAIQVMCHHLDRQPGGVGGETARLRDRRSLEILENPRVGGSHNVPIGLTAWSINKTDGRHEERANQVHRCVAAGPADGAGQLSNFVAGSAKRPCTAEVQQHLFSPNPPKI